MLEKLRIANTEEGPKKMKAVVKLWQTDGVGTRLFFAPNGSAMAASGAHSSVQVCTREKKIFSTSYPLPLKSLPLIITKSLFGLLVLPPQVMSSH